MTSLALMQHADDPFAFVLKEQCYKGVMPGLERVEKER